MGLGVGQKVTVAGLTTVVGVAAATGRDDVEQGVAVVSLVLGPVSVDVGEVLSLQDGGMAGVTIRAGESGNFGEDISMVKDPTVRWVTWSAGNLPHWLKRRIGPQNSHSGC